MKHARIWSVTALILTLSVVIAGEDAKSKKEAKTVTGLVVAELDEEGKNIVSGEISDADGKTYFVVLDAKGKAMLKALDNKRGKVTGVLKEKVVDYDGEEFTEVWITVQKFEEVKEEPEEEAEGGGGDVDLNDFE